MQIIFHHPGCFEYVEGVLATGFSLVFLGHLILGLLRNYDDYRANRPSRDRGD